jgi:molybdopterin adenylyltransferase
MGFMGNGDTSSKQNKHTISVGVLTVSDRGARGEYEDLSGPAIEKLVMETLDAEIVCTDVVPDERAVIRDKLAEWADDRRLDLVLTTGGTGFTSRDVTPEATGDVIERDAPGFAEAMRAASLRVTPHALLSRARAGIRGQTLIINLPGSPRAASENLRTVLDAIPHGVELLQGRTGADKHHTYSSH